MNLTDKSHSQWTMAEEKDSLFGSHSRSMKQKKVEHRVTHCFLHLFDFKRLPFSFSVYKHKCDNGKRLKSKILQKSTCQNLEDPFKMKMAKDS
jgi:hypothetical protein